MEKVVAKVTLDEEWVLLIQTARNLGISIEEIRNFLETGNVETKKKLYYYKK